MPKQSLSRLGRVPIVLAALTLAMGVAAAVAQRPPAWAFPKPHVFAPLPKGEVGIHLPGVKPLFPKSAADQLFTAADWRPGDHPPMPGIVAHGRRPEVYACGLCHLADGQGKPENASLAGLPAPYIVEQIAELRAGRRGSAVPGMVPPAMMAHVAASASPAEVATAARYFSGLTYHRWVKVVETRQVPRLQVTPISTYEPAPGGGAEPLGDRIVEMPFWSLPRRAGDSPQGFVAYVPVGAVRAGGALAASGEGRTLACNSCHGATLQGLGLAPRLAGRSPTYIARQLFDFRGSARRGPAAAQMNAVTARLTDADVLDLAAYMGSLRP
jgi:cytochrome c553